MDFSRYSNLFGISLAFYWNSMCKREGKLFDSTQEILITVFVLLPVDKELWYIYLYISIYSKYYSQKILLFDK